MRWRKRTAGETPAQCRVQNAMGVPSFANIPEPRMARPFGDIVAGGGYCRTSLNGLDFVGGLRSEKLKYIRLYSLDTAPCQMLWYLLFVHSVLPLLSGSFRRK